LQEGILKHTRRQFLGAMRARQGRHGARDNWCVLEYNTQTKKADRLINYDGAVRKISVPTVVLCYL